MPPGDPLAEEIVRLYALPPEEFVAARNAAAKACRQERRKDDAARIAALRKPSVIESALNRTARRDPDTTAAWAAATRATADAQSATIGGADAAGLRAAVERLRAANDAMLDATVATIGDESKRDDIAALLRSLPIGAVDQLLAGVLGSAARTEDDLFAGAPDPPPRPRRERPAGRARALPAPPTRTRATEAEPLARPAPTQPSRRERELGATVERRRAALRDADAARNEARTALQGAQKQLDAAEQEHAAAEAALDKAEAALRAEQKPHRR